MKNFINKDFIRYIGLLGNLGLIMVINILICVFIYKLIERFLFKSDLLFIALVILGVISGFYSIYKLIIGKK